MRIVILLSHGANAAMTNLSRETSSVTDQPLTGLLAQPTPGNDTEGLTRRFK